MSLMSTMLLVPLSAMLAILVQQSHLLMVLLALESLTLTMILIIPATLVGSGMPMNMLALIMLSFGACEASLGLSLLVMMSRTIGSDLAMNLSLNKC